MGSVTSKFFKRKEPEQLYIHIYNMKQKQLVEIIMKYNDGHNGLSDCVSKMIKSINFSAYGWDVYDGKIVIYFTTNKYDAISHSYSYFVNCMDNNYRELIDYSVSLDYYFNINPDTISDKGAVSIQLFGTLVAGLALMMVSFVVMAAIVIVHGQQLSTINANPRRT